MTHIHYFNPDHDLALAYGGENYTPTPRAIVMRRDLRLLAAWLAADEESVLAEDGRDREWLGKRLPKVHIITPDRLSSIDNALYHPWGWSIALKHRLSRLGANANDFPGDEELAKIRQLSHRRLTIDFHREYTAISGAAQCEPPTELFTLDEVQAYAEQNPRCFLKQPWSGSGHGIYRAYTPTEPRMLQWAGGVIRRQGSLLAEPALDAVFDCATEWESRGGRATLRGFSVFETDRHNQFIGTCVAPNEELKSKITALYHDLDLVVERQKVVINHLVAPHYDGPLGIDMLVYRKGNEYALNPCIEINLRQTMGHLACALACRGLRGKLRIIDAGSLTAADTPITPITAVTELVAVITR